VDDIIVFHALTVAEIARIVDIQAGYLRKRLADRKMTIELSDRSRDHLARTGFDPVYGARPLKRAIQHEIENPLARQILEGRFKEGARIVADYDPRSEEMVFTEKKGGNQ